MAQPVQYDEQSRCGGGIQYTPHFYNISATININFYSATVIIRYASQEEPSIQTNRRPQGEDGEHPEAVRPKDDRRPNNPRRPSDRSFGTQTAGDGVGSQENPSGRSGPRIRFTPGQHPMASGHIPIVSAVGNAGPQGVVRTPGVDVNERDSLDGNPFGLQGRYPDITPVTHISEGGDKGRTLGQIHSLLPKISDLRIRKQSGV